MQIDLRITDVQRTGEAEAGRRILDGLEALCHGHRLAVTRVGEVYELRRRSDEQAFGVGPLQYSLQAEGVLPGPLVFRPGLPGAASRP